MGGNGNDLSQLNKNVKNNELKTTRNLTAVNIVVFKQGNGKVL